jgi:hypothetical protein
MWMERIRCGVLEVQTEKGPSYLRPSLGERIRLLWTFRNFRLLPREVLNQRELTLVAGLLERGNVQPNADCLIGIIEWTPPVPAVLPEQSRGKQSGPAVGNGNTPRASTSPVRNTRSSSRRRRRKRRSQDTRAWRGDVAVACPAKINR